MSEKTVKIRLKGHETFILREGWLAKGLRAVSDDPKVFSEYSRRSKALRKQKTAHYRAYERTSENPFVNTGGTTE